MKNFTGDRREGGFRGGDRGGNFQKKSWGSDREVKLYKATCGECGKSCEVPFRPTGEKPVYCNDCFNKKRDPSDTRGARSDFAPKRPPAPEYSRGRAGDFNDRFAPRADSRPLVNKPVSDNTGKQLAEISMKLDRLIAAMEKMTTPTTKIAKEITDLPAQPGAALIKASKPKAEKKVAKKKVVVKKKK